MLRAGLATSLLIVAFSFWPSCKRSAKDLSPAQLAQKLAPYDFSGHTATLLAKACARSHFPRSEKGWVCASTYLDWYLWAAFHQRSDSIRKLARTLKVDCPGQDAGCGLKVVEVLDQLFATLENGPGGDSLKWRIRSARNLLALQLEGAARWDGAYLKGMARLAKDSPVATKAGIIVAGATADGLQRIAAAKLWHRPKLLGRLLGFACPEDQPEACPLGCPGLTSRLVQTRPELRKKLIALHCPLDQLGFSSRDQTVFLSRSSQRLAKNVSFLAQTLARLSRSDHPLARSLHKEFAALSKRLDAIVFPMALPELSPTERGYRKTAFCGPALEPATAPLFVSLGPADLTAGISPLLHSRGDKLVVPGMAELLVFPGRPVPRFDAPSIDQALLVAGNLWKQETGQDAKDLVALLVDAQVSSGRLLKLLRALSAIKRTTSRLIFRNLQGTLGGLTVRIKPCPDRPHRWKSRMDQAVTLWADGASVFVTSSTGPLAEKPFSGPVSDLAGLRAALEHTRRAYRQVQAITFFLGSDLKYLDLARLLGSAVRNSSGRTLYSQVEISTCTYGPRAK